MVIVFRLDGVEHSRMMCVMFAVVVVVVIVVVVVLRCGSCG